MTLHCHRSHPDTFLCNSDSTRGHFAPIEHLAVCDGVSSGGCAAEVSWVEA